MHPCEFYLLPALCLQNTQEFKFVTKLKNVRNEIRIDVPHTFPLSRRLSSQWKIVTVLLLMSYLSLVPNLFASLQYPWAFSSLLNLLVSVILSTYIFIALSYLCYIKLQNNHGLSRCKGKRKNKKANFF